ncbi:Accumulation-associated protein [Thelohanellus kitauei]|uniref:Accumulation-associated protein n=1 Tax=Thelohanellus kitauei TaxID=669202 RepID=A0A0C2MNP0_THEKT|nr:Accumulation-associated protein [Thelohanellus kitauei]
MNDPNNNLQGWPCPPGFPNQPICPCQPNYPNQPSYPYQPMYPYQPTYPNPNSYPYQPSYPCQPAYPCQPGYPSYPCLPSYPHHPGYPIQPPGFYPSGFPYQPPAPYPIPGFPQPGTPQPGIPCMSQPLPNTYPIPSLRPTPNMSVQVAVGTIKTCIDTFKTDELGIYNILAHCTSQFREEIKDEFERTYGKKLIQEFKFMFDDDSRYLIQCLLYTGSELDAFILNKAMVFNE